MQVCNRVRRSADSLLAGGQGMWQVQVHGRCMPMAGAGVWQVHACGGATGTPNMCELPRLLGPKGPKSLLLHSRGLAQNDDICFCFDKKMSNLVRFLVKQVESPFFPEVACSLAAGLQNSIS